MLLKLDVKTDVEWKDFIAESLGVRVIDVTEDQVRRVKGAYSEKY